MTLLAIVPVRGGSKGVPGKALRPVAGVPLLLRTLRTIAAAGIADRIVVSTDCPDIAAFARVRGYEVLDRPAELADDFTPLAAVTRHVVETLNWTGLVGVFQATCPLVEPATLKRMVEGFADSDDQWTITVVADHHLRWRDGHPLAPRLNRQLTDPVWQETGAAQLMTAKYAVTQAGRCGTFEVSEREGLDIDTPSDLVLADRLAAGARVHFVVAMGHEIGTGHFWRSLTIARALLHHRVSWGWRGQPPRWAVDRAASVVTAVDDDQPPALTIFDCLTPDDNELLAAKLAGTRTLVMEGSSRFADREINALLTPDDLRYLVMRDEFLCLPPRTHSEEGRRVLVTFGGTDPANLTARAQAVIPAGVEVRVLRPGVPENMVDAMLWADLVVTSQGRTVLEAAACGTPTISIAANERESRHHRIAGVSYLGLHTTVTDQQLADAVTRTLDSRQLRMEMGAAASVCVDGRGLARVTAVIDGMLANL